MKAVLSERIEYIKADENPLSSDVIFISGDSTIWIFDVGANDEAFEAISNVILNKSDDIDINIIISHFHRDHMKNFDRLLPLIVDRNVNVYCSKNTHKYTKMGNIVESDMYFDDGVKVHIFPISSTHSKGCLGLEVNEEIAFLADAIYPQYRYIDEKEGNTQPCVDKFDDRNAYRKQHKVYNVQLLKEQIMVLKSLKCEKFFLGHEKRPDIRKNIIVKFLDSVYEKREPGEPFILQ